jgi:hypothetical protein
MSLTGRVKRMFRRSYSNYDDDDISSSARQSYYEGGVPSVSQTARDGGIPSVRQTYYDQGIPSVHRAYHGGGIPSVHRAFHGGGIPSVQPARPEIGGIPSIARHNRAPPEIDYSLSFSSIEAAHHYILSGGRHRHVHTEYQKIVSTHILNKIIRKSREATAFDDLEAREQQKALTEYMYPIAVEIDEESAAVRVNALLQLKTTELFEL